MRLNEKFYTNILFWLPQTMRQMDLIGEQSNNMKILHFESNGGKAK